MMVNIKQITEEVNAELEENPNATILLLHYATFQSMYFKRFNKYPEEVRSEYMWNNVRVVRTFDLTLEEFIVL